MHREYVPSVAKIKVEVKMRNAQKTENDHVQTMTLSYVKPETHTQTVQIRGLAKD